MVRMGVQAKAMGVLAWGAACAALLSGPAPVWAVTLPPTSTPAGYVCRLLINEVPFPGERGYRSEEDSITAMNQLLHVLDGRLRHVPSPYRQEQIAAARADDIIDVITAKGQFEGFSRDGSGKPTMAARVTHRVDNLVSIAGKGAPGKFARLLNHAVTIASGYLNGGAGARDQFAGVTDVNGIRATGRAFSWMTDEVRFHPGGNYLRIPDGLSGSLGGNRFFTLRQEPK